MHTWVLLKYEKNFVMDTGSTFHIHIALHNYLTALIETEYDLQMNHITILECIDNKSCPIMSEISIAAGIVQSSMTGVVDYLEKRKLVKRKRSTGNRRVVELHLTKKGNVTLEEIKVKFNEFINSGLNKSEQTYAAQIAENLWTKVKKEM